MPANLMFTEQELEKTFQLSYFLFPDLNLALNLTIASCDVISRVRRVESRRLKSQKHYGEMIPSDALLQYAVFLASDGMEKEQENFGRLFGSTYQITRDDFNVRYIKHLIWRASKQKSCYMAIALGCLLYRYNPMDIWHLSFGHFDSGNIRRVKAKVIRWLKERFEHTGIVVNSGRDIKFSAPSSQDLRLVQEALKVFTPWGHSHIQAPPSKTVLEVLFDDLSSVSDRLRIHAITDPDCAGIANLIREYNSLGTSIQFNDPDEMLEIPAFEGQPSDDPWKRLHPPSLTDTEKLLLRKAVEQNVRTRGIAYNIEELYEDLYSHFVGYEYEEGTDDLEPVVSEGVRALVCEIVSGAGSKDMKRYIDWCVSSIVSRESATNSYADRPSDLDDSDGLVRSDRQLCVLGGYQTEEAVWRGSGDGESFMELLDKVKAGSAAAERLLEHETYRRKVLAICSHYGNGADEEDLRQELHEKVLLNIDRLKWSNDENQFFKWLFAMARNAYIDVGRRVKPVATGGGQSSLSGDKESETMKILFLASLGDVRSVIAESVSKMAETLRYYESGNWVRLLWVDERPTVRSRSACELTYWRTGYGQLSTFDSGHFWDEYRLKNLIAPIIVLDESSSMSVFNDTSPGGYLDRASIYVGYTALPLVPYLCNYDLSARTEPGRLTRTLGRVRLWVYCASIQEKQNNLYSPIADRLGAGSLASDDARSPFKGWRWPLSSAHGTGVPGYYDLRPGRDGSYYVQAGRWSSEGDIRGSSISDYQSDDWYRHRRSIMNFLVTKYGDLYADEHIISAYERRHPKGSLFWHVEAGKDASTARSQRPFLADGFKYYATAPTAFTTELRSLRSYTVSNGYWRLDYFMPPSLWPATLTKVFREGAGIMKESNEWRTAGKVVLQAPAERGRADYRCSIGNITCSGKPEGALNSMLYRLSDSPDRDDGADIIRHGFEFNIQRRQNYTGESNCLVVHIDGRERLRFSPKDKTCRPFRVSMDSMFIEVRGQDNYGYLLLAVFLVPDPGSLKKGDLCEGTITTEAGQVIGCIISPILSKSGNTVGNRVRITWNGPQDPTKLSEPKENLQEAAELCALYDLAEGRTGDEQIV